MMMIMMKLFKCIPANKILNIFEMKYSKKKKKIFSFFTSNYNVQLWLIDVSWRKNYVGLEMSINVTKEKGIKRNEFVGVKS